MYEPLSGTEMAILYTKVTVCSMCGAVFFSGYGWEKSFLVHDAWHEKLDRLFDNVPIV